MEPEIRHITDEERSEALRLRVYGFADYPPEELEAPDIARMVPAEILGAFHEGQLVASAHTYRFRQAVRGVEKPMGGVAAVAAYPEVRRRGVVRRLMTESLAEMHREGLAVSMLHPFKVSFYENFGYVTSDESIIAEYPTRAFAKWLDDAAAAEVRIERRPAEAGWPLYAELDADGLPGAHGSVVHGSIGKELAHRRLDDHEIALFSRNGRTVAGAIFRKEGAEPHGILQLLGYRFLGRDGLRSVLRFIALHIDQCATVRMNVAPASPHGRLFQYTGDIDGEVTVMPMRRPWMVRIIDVVAALNGIPAPAPGELTLSLTDRHCPWNDGRYRLSSDGEQLQAERVGAAEAGPGGTGARPGTGAGTETTSHTGARQALGPGTGARHGPEPGVQPGSSVRPNPPSDARQNPEPGPHPHSDIALTAEQLAALLYGARPPAEILTPANPAAASEEAGDGASGDRPAQATDGATRNRPARATNGASRNGPNRTPNEASAEAVELLARWFPERFLWNDWHF